VHLVAEKKFSQCTLTTPARDGDYIKSKAQSLSFRYFRSTSARERKTQRSAMQSLNVVSEITVLAGFVCSLNATHSQFFTNVSTMFQQSTSTFSIADLAASQERARPTARPSQPTNMGWTQDTLSGAHGWGQPTTNPTSNSPPKYIPGYLMSSVQGKVCFLLIPYVQPHGFYVAIPYSRYLEQRPPHLARPRHSSPNPLNEHRQ
jgi:hypothetical protein